MGGWDLHISRGLKLVIKRDDANFNYHPRTSVKLSMSLQLTHPASYL